MTAAVLEAIQMPSFFSPRPSAPEKTNVAIMWKYLGLVDKVRRLLHFLGASIQRSTPRRTILTIVLMGVMLITRAAPAQEMSLRAVYNAFSGVMAPIWVGQEAALFTKHGVNVDLKYLAATTAVQGMVGGGEEVGLVGNQGIDAKLEGADLIYVASCLPVFVFQVYARPEIKSMADLKGKMVAVTQPPHRPITLCVLCLSAMVWSRIKT